jgi:hypothetical protein
MMKTPSRQAKALLAAALLGLLPAAPAAAAETADAVEKDLSAIFQRMDRMKTELDRIEELASAPKATMLRVEIAGDNSAPASPTSARFLVEGRLEEEREWSKIERESFADKNVPMPLVFLVPYLPGNYPARLELLNPNWKTPPAVDFQAAVKMGETTVVKLRLAVPPGKTDPVLTRAPEPPPAKNGPPAKPAAQKQAGK